MRIFDCKRCRQSWCYRGTGHPIRCGKCKSPYWEKERAQIAAELRSTIAGVGVLEGKEHVRTTTVSPVEIDLCGFRSYNDTDGEWYLCGKEKGHGIKHGLWIKE